MRARGAAAAFVAALTAIGCVAVLEVEDVDYPRADASAAPGDATTDAGTQGPSNDASTDADGSAVLYDPVDDSSFWSFADVQPSDAGLASFLGAAFDGRYVVFVPQVSGVFVRYDTTTPFGPAGTWETFDVKPFVDGGGAPPFGAGVAFDGRYMYFPPGLNGQSQVIRYDTTQSFGAASSWSVFYMEAVDPNLKGYSGATYRDPYVYFVPSYGVDTSDHGHVVRFDRRKAFSDPASWEFTDLKAGLSPDARGYASALVAGTDVYFVPGALSGGAGNNVLARYDTTRPFAADAGGWTAHAIGSGPFFGGVFDGRYVHLAPSARAPLNVARHDARDGGDTWGLFDTASLPFATPSCAGGAFDGRRVFFVPSYRLPGGRGTLSGVVTAYDTASPFGAKTSWSQIDLASLDARAVNYQGAAFDGRYVYFAPASGAPVARFDARTPRAPFDPAYASFY